MFVFTMRSEPVQTCSSALLHFFQHEWFQDHPQDLLPQPNMLKRSCWCPVVINLHLFHQFQTESLLWFTFLLNAVTFTTGSVGTWRQQLSCDHAPHQKHLGEGRKSLLPSGSVRNLTSEMSELPRRKVSNSSEIKLQYDEMQMHDGVKNSWFKSQAKN